MNPLLKKLSTLLSDYQESSSQAPIDTARVFLTPTSRFLVPMIWQLTEKPLANISGIKDLLTPLNNDDFRARRSIIANRFDPLVKLAGKLRINRYLTTNYDFEIERMYQDRGYRRFGSRHSNQTQKSGVNNPYNFRTDGIGGVVRDLSFSSEHSADLLTFAAGGTGADANIFHLHGSATRDDDIVITERDYMDMYLRDDPNREVVDESILMAFAGTPILFLGLGMEETDLLRPLRQFISDQDRLIGYRAIVLMSATKDFDSRTKMAAGLYTRYGAHTIFYGSGEVKVEVGKDSNSKPLYAHQSLDWLHRIFALIESLRNSIKERQTLVKSFIENQSDDVVHARDKLAASGSKVVAPITTLKKLVKEVGTLGDDLSEINDSCNSEPAIAALFGLDVALFTELYGENGSDFVFANITPENLPSLHNCHFTSRREGDATIHSNHRNIKTDGVVYTSFYTEILTEILRACMREFETNSIMEALRVLNSMLTASEGLKGAFMTASLCASLDGLEQEWRSWWNNWQEKPPHREARFEQIIGGDRIDRAGTVESKITVSDDELQRRLLITLPSRHVRHRVESVITDLSHCRHSTAPVPVPDQVEPYAFTTEFRTRVRAFDSFIYDVATLPQNRISHSGRRVQTIAAARGQGKGILFSTLSTRLGLTSYISAAHFTGHHPDRPKPVFITAIFVNLSFSPEIASVFDMTTRCLRETIATLDTLCNPDSQLLDSNLQPSYNNALLQLNKTSENDRQFLLNMLFSGEGLPPAAPGSSLLSQKNREQLINYKSVVDKAILFTNGVKERRDKGKPRLKTLSDLMIEFEHLSQKCRETGIFGLNFVPRLLMCFNAIDLLFDNQKRAKNLEISQVLRFLSSKNASSIPFDLIAIGSIDRIGSVFADDHRLQRFFHMGNNAPEREKERLAMRAARHQISTMPAKGRHPSEINYLHNTYQVNPIEFLVDNFPALALALFINRDRHEKELQPEFLKTITNEAKTHYEELVNTRKACWFNDEPPEVNKIYHNTRSEMNKNIVTAFLREIPEASRNNLGIPESQNYSGRKDNGFLHKLYIEDDDATSNANTRDWINLQQALRGNRYCLTILMAAAEYLVFNDREFQRGGNAANTFLRNTVSHLLNASVSQKEEMVLETVMNVYRERSIIGNTDYDHELHLLLMRNIAVLGCPVSPNVLVRLPEIRDYFNTVSMEDQLSRRRMVARALAVLSDRGLVFRLRPHPKLIRLHKKLQEVVEEERGKIQVAYKEKERNISEAFNETGNKLKQALEDNEDNLIRALEKPLDKSHRLSGYQEIFRKWPAELEYRYALHRQVQSYCFERLGHLTAPPVSANNFAPTLYASMSSRVVRLSNEGYLFLRRLLLGLSQYPDIRHQDAARDMPIFTDDDVVTRVQALRAAMSLVRTSLSIAAVSRFDDQTTNMHFTRKRGHFETYKVRLRWILRKAWEVHNSDDREYDAETLETRINALYFDEIVWLYNEVAVICLVQGALVDGIGHVRQAIKINKEIEGDFNNGPMHNMLSLNLAIIQLERGRLNSANRRLQEIITNETGIGKRVALLASGYKALISQLQGRLNEAREEFGRIIPELEKDDEVRALAVMIHHQARLVARENDKEAVELLKRARDYAETGGHEDVRHRILITEVSVSQRFQPQPLLRVAEDRVKLREVESYARMMGLSSLLVEVLHEQGTMLLTVGDTIGSGRLLTRAMAIARRNDMTLRLNSIMTNYARILIARKRISSAKRLLNSSLAMAKRTGHSLEVVRVHTLIAKADTLTQDSNYVW